MTELITPLGSLRESLVAAFDRSLGGAKRVRIVDFPFNLNPGDSAIWLGEMAVLKELGVSKVDSTHASRREGRSRKSSIRGLDAVLIHGGGNFGDIWPEHNLTRQEAIENAHGIPIIQMPVSLHVSNPECLKNLRSAVARHGQVTFMWRDERSYVAGAEFFESSTHVMVPDAATALNLSAVSSPETDVLVIQRLDKEADTLFRKHEAVDWSFDARFKLASGWWLMQAMDRWPLPRNLSNPAWQRLYSHCTTSQLRYATTLLSSASVVVTDRLHGHILATVAGVTNVAYPDRNGKLEAYYDAWHRPVTHAHWASSQEEAIALAEQIKG